MDLLPSAHFRSTAHVKGSSIRRSPRRARHFESSMCVYSCSSTEETLVADPKDDRPEKPLGYLYSTVPAPVVQSLLVSPSI
jgi:hypothetical protein